MPIRCVMFQLLVACVASLAGVQPAVAQNTSCGLLGDGGFAETATGGVGFVLAHGRFTCDGVEIDGLGFANIPNKRKQADGGGSPVSTSLSYNSATAFAGSELGYSRARTVAGAFNQVGQRSNADSAWGDLLDIPGLQNQVLQVTVVGHLDGSEIFNAARNQDAAFYYAFEVGAAGYPGEFITGQAFDGVDRWTAQGNGSVSIPETSFHLSNSSIHDSFSISLVLPVNTPIGIQAFLSAQTFNNGVVQGSHTAAIDEIILPPGFSITSGSELLRFDGVGYSYPETTSVPEPATYLSTLLGCLFVAFGVRRRHR